MQQARRHFGRGLEFTLALLLVPLTLTLANPDAALNGGEGGGFDWSLGDFLLMGALLLFVSVGAQLAASRFQAPAMKVSALIAVVFVGFALWAELAVGAVSQLVSLIG